MNVDNFSSVVATVGGGFFVGLLIGFAIKKIIKIAAVIVGLFLATLAYLQYEQILNINWNKLQGVSQNTVTTIASTTTQIHDIGGTNSTNDPIAANAMTNFGIPLTGSMALGFGIGFMKG